MCSVKTPKVQPASPPPSYIPESVNEEVQRVKNRERKRAMAAFGRDATIGASAGPPIAPTTQQRTLLGA
jgi:hypothetical protein